MPYQFVDYKGLQVGNATPAGVGGAAVDGNMREIADRAGPVAQVNGAPGATDDDTGAGGNGTFYTWSKWRDTATDDVYICVDPATGAAVWKLLTGGGGLSQSGGGTFTASGGGANIGGRCDTGGSLIASGEGSLISFFNDSSGVIATASGDGTVLTGHVLFNGDGTVTCGGMGSTIHAGLLFPAAGANIQTSADFNHIKGRTSGASELKTTADDAYILAGLSSGGAKVTISGSSYGLLRGNTSNLDVDGVSNFVVGDLDGSGVASILRVLSPAPPNDTTSALLFAHSSAGGDVTVGDVAVRMIGGGVLGSAIGAAAVLRATRSGAFAIAAVVAGETAEATAVNAVLLGGPGSNSTANSLQIGDNINFRNDGTVLMNNLPGAAGAAGTLWNDAGTVKVA